MNSACVAISTGVSSCAGNGVDAAWDFAVSKDAKGLRKVSIFDSPRYGDKLAALSPIDSSSKISRCVRMLYAAADEAFSKIDVSKISPERIGVFFGTSIGSIFECENILYGDNPNLRVLSTYECSTPAELLARRIKSRGACISYSTACSSSSLAFSAACNSISQGDCDIAVVCGADTISRITVNGFGSLQLLSMGASKPFDKNRDGINLGEGAAVAVLASEDVAKKIGAKIEAYISGWGCSSDAYHPTAPHPEGDGAVRAISEALRKSEMLPSDISYYNAHGTGTKGNDTSEVAALRKVFGDSFPPFSSIKGYFGHTLGASGVLNAVLSIEALKRNTLVPNGGFKTFDEEIGTSPQAEAEKKNIDNIVSSSFGFGGNNGCIVISKKIKSPRAKVDRKPLFIYGAGIVSSSGIGIDEVLKNTQDDFVGGECLESNLLKDVAPLKKRKWTRLHQMCLQAATDSISSLDIKSNPSKIAVCLGTGLGMVGETYKFLKNVADKKEADPMPTTFTNSVHNAVSGAVSIHCGFKALNSAVTAKEISFEAALSQAWDEINSGAIESVLVGSADENQEIARCFMNKAAIFSEVKIPFSEIAATYFMGIADSCNSKPIAEVLSVDIARRDKNPETEFLKISKILESVGLKFSDISKWYVPFIFNSYNEKYLKLLAEKFGIKNFERLDLKLGANYSVSACAPILSFGKSGIVAQYAISSSGMRAVSIFKIL